MALTEGHHRLNIVVGGSCFSVLGRPMLSRGRGLRELGIGELGFAQEELDFLVAQSGGVLGNVQAGWLRGMRGWPALVEVLVAGAVPPPSLRAALERVLDKILPGCASDRLLECWVAVALNPQICGQTLEEDGFCKEKAVLSCLLEVGLVEASGVEGARRYQCPTLFAPTLKAVGRALLSEKRRAELREAYVRRLFPHDPLTIMDTLFEEGDFAPAEHYLRQYYSLPTAGSTRMSPHFADVPPEDLAPYPNLLFVLLKLASAKDEGWPGRHQKVARLLRAAAASSYPEEDPFRTFMTMVAERALGNHAEAAGLARLLEEQLDRTPWSPREPWANLPLLYVELVNTALSVGDLSLATRAAEAGQHIAETTGYAEEGALIQQQLAALDFLMTDFACGAQRYGRARATSAQKAPAQGFFGVDQDALGFMELLSDPNSRGFSPSAALEEAAFRTEQWPILAILESYAVRATAGPQEAYEVLRGHILAGQDLFPASSFMQALVAIRLSVLALGSGNWHAVEGVLDTVQGRGSWWEQQRARHHLVRGEYHEALALAADSLERTGLPIVQNEARMIMAAAFHLAGDEDAGQEVFDTLISRILGPYQAVHFGGIPYPTLLALARGTSSPARARVLESVEALSEHYRMPWHPPLSPAEHRALEALVDERPLAALANEMFLSVNTLKSQVRGVYAKLGVSDRDSAVRKARQLGWLEIPPAG